MALKEDPGLVRGLAGLWYASRMRKMRELPQPHDAPTATAGTDNDADHVLVIGGELAVGWGVMTHQLAIPGSLARALSRRTGRGARVTVRANAEARLPTIGQMLGDTSLGHYSTVLLFPGTRGAGTLTPLAQWRRDLLAIVEQVASPAAGHTPVLILGVPKLSSIPTFGGAFGKVADRHALRINHSTAQLCDHPSRMRFIPFQPSATRNPDRFMSAADYTNWAHIIAEGLAPGLAELHTATMNKRFAEIARMKADAREHARQQEVDELDIVDTSLDDALDTLAALAQRVFRTEAAEVNIVDRDRTWNRAKAGGPRTEAPREDSFCSVTIQGWGSLLVEDAQLDARFAANPYVVGNPHIRFYAGLPLRAPSGHHVGTLCVWDSKPRAGHEVDLFVLQQLASMIEGQLWRTPSSPDREEPPN